MITRRSAKAILKNRGWSYRSAAPLLGITYVSLSRILNGTYQNRRVLTAIETMPDRKAAQ